MKTNDFIIGSIIGNGRISIAEKPAIHPNINMAKAEAERLANANPGKTFVVLEVKGTCAVQKVIWS